MVKVQTEQSTSAKKGTAMRLTFAYEGADIRLIDRQIVDKPTQPSAPLLERGKDQQAQSGFWVELQGRRDKPLYRLVMSNPIRFHAEVPDDEGGFTNVPRPKPSGTFFVVVPRLPEAQSIVLFSSTLGPEAKPDPAEPIARFRLRDREEK
jgi:hypothetical protein